MYMHFHVSVVCSFVCLRICISVMCLLYAVSCVYAYAVSCVYVYAVWMFRVYYMQYRVYMYMPFLMSIICSFVCLCICSFVCIMYLYAFSCVCFMQFHVSMYICSFVCLCICIFVCLLCTVLWVYGSTMTHDMLPSLKHTGISQLSNVLMRSTEPDVKTHCYQIDTRYNYSNRYEV